MVSLTTCACVVLNYTEYSIGSEKKKLAALIWREVRRGGKKVQDWGGEGVFSVVDDKVGQSK